MPLVSGVCRAASAPKLSHGGSRLNASKPEANPKTSCPFKKKKNTPQKKKDCFLNYIKAKEKRKIYFLYFNSTFFFYIV
jgi:hypothetical protein